MKAYPMTPFPWPWSKPGGAITVNAGARAAAAAQPPVVLTRNGREYTFNSGNVRAGAEIKVTTSADSGQSE
jgi:hypothetical protein